MESAPPSRLLSRAVHSYIQIRCNKPTLYPVMPDGTQAVFISSSGVLFGGAQTQARDICLTEKGDYFGIRFLPGALRYFFDLNLSEITDQFTDASYLPCETFHNLHYGLYSQTDFCGRANVCEQWLLSHYRPLPKSPFDHALSLIYRYSGTRRICDLADDVGWSSRHLNRLFHQHTGMNTKAFSRIVRAQHIGNLLFSKPHNMLDVALESGFYDQSHFLKDFQQTMQLSPSALLKRYMSDFYNT